MEQREWLHFLGPRRGAALKSARGSRDGSLISPSDPGQPRLGQYAPVTRSSGGGEMEKRHEARRLARIDPLILSACQPLWALHFGSDPTHPFVTHHDRVKNHFFQKLCRTYLLCAYY